MTRDQKLGLQTSSEGETTIVSVSGEVDLHSSPDLRTAIIDVLGRKPRRLIIDLSNVRYMDSSGVGTMVEAKRRADRGGGQLVLAGLQPRVQSLLEIAQLDRFFDIAPTVEDARER